MNWKKRKSNLILMVIVMISVGLMMRSPITTIPLIIDDLARHLKVIPGSLGILTTLPLVMFMIFSNLASTLLKYLGFKKSLMFDLSLLVIGSLLRLVVTLPTMIIGTILIGISIAYLNVFMPSFVAAYFPEQVGVYTTLYTFSMMFGSAVFNMITAPVVKSLGWWWMLFILVLVPLLAGVLWLLAMRFLPEQMQATKTNSSKENKSVNIKIWNNPKAWLFLIAFGCQSTVMYTFTAWMPSLMRYHQVTPGAVGLIMACFSLIGLPVSIFLPQLLLKFNKRGQSGLVLSAGVAGLIAACMLFMTNISSIFFWLVEGVLIGYSVNLFFIFVMTMFAVKTTNPYETARLSGMAQSGGYLIAALGPVLYGMAFTSNPIGIGQNLAYVLIILSATVLDLVIVTIKDI